MPRPAAGAPHVDSGTYTDGGSTLVVPRNPAGATPTMVSGRPFTETTSPTASGAPARSETQKSWPTTATGWPPIGSSASRPKRRPAAGASPSVGKYEPETHDAQTLALRPPWDRWARSVWWAAMSVNAFCSRCRSRYIG